MPRTKNPRFSNLPDLPDVAWSIYSRPEAWPEISNRVFLPNAVRRLASELWGSDDIDLEPIRNAIDTVAEGSAERNGMLWTMANLFAPLIIEGSLTVYCMPVAGGRMHVLRGHAWSPSKALSAVSEGVITLGSAAGAEPDHWVFLDPVEFDLLLELHSPAGAPPGNDHENLRRRHDRLAGIVLANIRTIAATHRSALTTRANSEAARTRLGHDPTPAEFDVMFAGARRTLSLRHQLALVDRAAGWLLARFDEDKDVVTIRKDLRERSRMAFDGYLIDEYFDDAWKMATEHLPERTAKGRRARKTPDAPSSGSDQTQKPWNPRRY